MGCVDRFSPRLGSRLTVTRMSGDDVYIKLAFEHWGLIGLPEALELIRITIPKGCIDRFSLDLVFVQLLTKSEDNVYSHFYLERAVLRGFLGIHFITILIS